MSERLNDFNSVLVSGKISYPKSGTSEKGAWAFFTLETQDKNKYGTFGTRIKCSGFGTQAEAMALAKDGDLAVVSGKLASKEKKDKDAAPDAKKVYETVVDVKQIQFITAGSGGGEATHQRATPNNPTSAPAKAAVSDDDMPF